MLDVKDNPADRDKRSFVVNLVRHWVNQIKPIIQGPLSCFKTSEELTGAERFSSTQEHPEHSLQRGGAHSNTSITT